MTKRHTIPDAFPTIHERDYYSRRITRGDTLRKIAQGQNYLWAHAGRIHGMCAYEGNGCTVYDDPASYAPAYSDYHEEFATVPGVPLASFMIPYNGWPSAAVDVTLQFSISATAGFSMNLVAAVYEMDGTFTSTKAAAVITDHTQTSYTFAGLTVPRGRPSQVIVFANLTHTGSSGEYASIFYITAKHSDPATQDLFDNPIPTWKTILYTFGDGKALHSAVMRQLARNTLALWARQPYLTNSYLGDQLNPPTGGYKFTAGPGVTKVEATFQTYLAHAGAYSLSITCSGGSSYTNAHTSVSGTVGYHTFTDTITVTPGSEVTMNLVWSGPNPGTTGDWSLFLYGVTVVEQGADPGDVIPAAFQPIDEELFTADELDDATVLNKLISNDKWLLANRPRVLVSDWMHRTLKRLDVDDNGIPTPSSDWTRGNGASTVTDPSAGFPYGAGGVLKNITLRGDNTTADDSGSTSHTNQDGEGKYPDGMATSWSASTGSTNTNPNLWPKTMTFRRHGQRLALFNITTPSSCRGGASAPSVVNGVTGAKMLMWVRGQRCTPAAMIGYHYQHDGVGKQVYERPLSGPGPANFYMQGRGVFAVDYASAGSTLIHFRPDMLNTGALPVDYAIGDSTEDTISQWVGPAIEQPLSVPSSLTIRGLLPAKVGANLVDGTDQPLEGLYFEMELNSACIMDAPLSQDLLDALDP